MAKNYESESRNSKNTEDTGMSSRNCGSKNKSQNSYQNGSRNSSTNTGSGTGSRNQTSNAHNEQDETESKY
ncbi:MAG: hypothetical protein LUG62_10940 [Clostridiales bacterium]|nr:hypothetical protein [Clostridiales bacterium]